jgi:hypothetical protein
MRVPALQANGICIAGINRAFVDKARERSMYHDDDLSTPLPCDMSVRN